MISEQKIQREKLRTNHDRKTKLAARDSKKSSAAPPMEPECSHHRQKMKKAFRGILVKQQQIGETERFLCKGSAKVLQITKGKGRGPDSAERTAQKKLQRGKIGKET
jgi:hypothetical protein